MRGKESVKGKFGDALIITVFGQSCKEGWRNVVVRKWLWPPQNTFPLGSIISSSVRICYHHSAGELEFELEGRLRNFRVVRQPHVITFPFMVSYWQCNLNDSNEAITAGSQLETKNFSVSICASRVSSTPHRPRFCCRY